MKVKAPPELVARLNDEIIEPIVNGGARVSNPSAWKDAFEAKLPNFRPAYADQLRVKIAAAEQECKRLGVDFNALVGTLATELCSNIRDMSTMSNKALFESRLRTMPEDTVLYSWQSTKNAEALVGSPADYWPKIEKSGLYMAESPTKTSGYTGGGDFGVMVEVHFEKGTQYADLTPRSVDNEVFQIRKLFHNNAETPDGYRKPLNRYSAIEGWWQMPDFGQARFRPFDPSKRSVEELRALASEVGGAGLPHLLASINRDLLARGEPAEGGVAKMVREVLEDRMSTRLGAWASEDRSRGYSTAAGDITSELIALQELADRLPGLAPEWIARLAAIDDELAHHIHQSLLFYEHSAAAERLGRTVAKPKGYDGALAG